jgi:hypothetical protein
VIERLLTSGDVNVAGGVAEQREGTVGRVEVAGVIAKERLEPVGCVAGAAGAEKERTSTGGGVVAAGRVVGERDGAIGRVLGADGVRKECLNIGATDTIANDPDLMSLKAGIYLAQGSLNEAAKFLSGMTEQTPFDNAFFVKVTQLRLERNHTEAIRLLQARLAQFQSSSEIYKGATQVYLAIAQRLAGDTAGARVTAEQHATRSGRSVTVSRITPTSRRGLLWLMP